jgi:hypothetical protein
VGDDRRRPHQSLAASEMTTPYLPQFGRIYSQSRRLSAGGSDVRPESEERRTVAVVPRQGALDAATVPPRCRCNTDAIDGGASPGRTMSRNSPFRPIRKAIARWLKS